MTSFPFGKAPYVILMMAVFSSVALLINNQRKKASTADLTLASSSPNHVESYRPAVPAFERARGVDVDVLQVSWNGLRGRLQNAMMAGSEVPDIVEIIEGSLAFFASGPLEDVGFVDLTDRIRAEGLDKRMVESRFSLFTSRGRIFALPHDVHPVMLAYRRDLVEELGIDVDKIQTWDDFVRMGEQITADLNGDGVVDRYAIALNGDAWSLRLLLMQRGVELFDRHGRVGFNNDLVVETIVWLIERTEGPKKIAYPLGGGQTRAKAIKDGLVLFHVTPDWDSAVLQREVPAMHGKLSLMPLPAWTPGGRRTSTQGGTGIAITKSCKNVDLAWDLIKHLYLDKEDLGKRFAITNILPALSDAWEQPEFHQPNPFYSGMRLGAAYAELAPDVPPAFPSPFQDLAMAQLDGVIGSAILYFRRHGNAGLRESIRADLEEASAYVARASARNKFLVAERQR